MNLVGTCALEARRITRQEIPCLCVPGEERSNHIPLQMKGCVLLRLCLEAVERGIRGFAIRYVLALIGIRFRPAVVRMLVGGRRLRDSSRCIARVRVAGTASALDLFSGDLGFDLKHLTR